MKSIGEPNLFNQIVKGYRKILRENLVGIYIHGSLSMNCYNPKFSDIDFLVIAKEKLDVKTKKNIIDLLLELSASAPEKGLEMSVVLQKELDNFKYPTPFELHYSKDWKEDYENNKIDYSKTECKDPDLAAHITVTINRGFCLYGKPIDKVFKPIPELYYIDSLIYDLEEVENNIINDPVYNVLNLCRVLLYLEEKKVASKSEGGEWALKHISENYQNIIHYALFIYQGKTENTGFENKVLVNFAKFMMKKINAKLKDLPEMNFRS